MQLKFLFDLLPLKHKSIGSHGDIFRVEYSFGQTSELLKVVFWFETKYLLLLGYSLLEDNDFHLTLNSDFGYFAEESSCASSFVSSSNTSSKLAYIIRN